MARPKIRRPPHRPRRPTAPPPQLERLRKASPRTGRAALCGAINNVLRERWACHPRNVPHFRGGAFSLERRGVARFGAASRRPEPPRYTDFQAAATVAA
jgi:hypothetical protein